MNSNPHGEGGATGASLFVQSVNVPTSGGKACLCACGRPHTEEKPGPICALRFSLCRSAPYRKRDKAPPYGRADGFQINRASNRAGYRAPERSIAADRQYQSQASSNGLPVRPAKRIEYQKANQPLFHLVQLSHFLWHECFTTSPISIAPPNDNDSL